METAGYDSSRPLAEQVAQRIKDYILEEKLKSGDKLPTETALAREMGVARSTVREAIKRLECVSIDSRLSIRQIRLFGNQALL